jgi:hypothetical protein
MAQRRAPAPPRARLRQTRQAVSPTSNAGGDMARVTGGDVVLKLMEEVAGLREEVKLLAQTVAASTKRIDGHLVRMGRMLGTMADETRRRFETLEARLDELEGRQ